MVKKHERFFKFTQDLNFECVSTSGKRQQPTTSHCALPPLFAKCPCLSARGLDADKYRMTLAILKLKRLSNGAGGCTAGDV